MPAPALAVLMAKPFILTGEHRPARIETLGVEGKVAPRRVVFAAMTYKTG
jgi:hypothetical protein